MLSKIKTWLTSSVDGKRLEQYAAIFAAAFASTAVATAESAAGTHGFQFTWSLLAGVAVAALKAGYDAVRSALTPNPVVAAPVAVAAPAAAPTTKAPV